MAATNFALFVVCLVALQVSVHAHSKLVVPLGWNSSPSAIKPCGGGTQATEAQATWVAGETVQVQWTVVAGDGVGDVTILLDPAGGTFTNKDPNATAPLVLLTGGNSPSLGDHYLPVVVPDVNCTGPNGLCTIQVFSTSNWIACSSVAILPPCTTNCTVPPPPQPVCVQAKNMGFCTSLSNTAVMVQKGQSAASVDANTRLTYNNYLNNTKVFNNGGSTKCKQLFQTFVCTYYTPPCPGSNGIAAGAACHGMCQNAMDACGLNETHIDLYNCAGLPLCAGESDAPIIAHTPILVLVATLFFAALLI